MFDEDLMVTAIRAFLIALGLGVLFFALKGCARELEPTSPVTQEFTLKDGTRCVAIGDKALVCDFAKPSR